MKQLITNTSRFLKHFLPLLLILGLSVSVAYATNAPKVDKHKAYGVACSSCHSKGAASARPDDSTCKGCHGSYAELAQKTAKLENIKAGVTNPHKSHTGEARCTGCHKNHGPSVLMCNQCHSPKFEMKVP